MRTCGLLLYSICFTALFCFGLSATAQDSSITFRRYTLNEGLCDNNVEYISQDSRGFIWISTKEGISRFDGKKFKNFYSEKTERQTFPSNSIRNIFEYKSNHILFISEGSVWAINNLTAHVYELPVKEVVFRIEKLPGNDILVSGRRFFYIYDSLFNLKESIKSPFTNTLGTAYSITPGLLLFSDAATHYLYSQKDRKTVPLILASNIKDRQDFNAFMGYDPAAGSLFFSNFWLGLFEFDLKGRLKHRYCHTGTPDGINSNDIKSLLIQNKKLYVGSTSGLNIIDRETGRIDAYHAVPGDNKSLSSDVIICLYSDRQNNIWAGTYKGGLCKITRPVQGITSISSFGKLHFTGENMHITKGNGDYLYANFFSGGTYRINKYNNSVSASDTVMIVSAWRSTMKGNKLLIAGSPYQQSLMSVIYDTESGQTSANEALRPYYGEADISPLVYCDRQGETWYSFNHNGGIIRQMPGNNSLKQYKSDSGFAIQYASEVAEDGDGNLWFSNNKTNIIVCWNRRAQRFSSFSVYYLKGLKALAGGGITYLYAGSGNTLWICPEGGGLIALNTKNNVARHYTLEDGLPSNYVNSVTEDHRHRIWAGTEKGLICLLQDEKKILRFNSSNGLPNNDLSSNSIYFDSSEAYIWMGNGNSLLKLDPDRLVGTVRSSVSVYLDEIWLNGKRITELSENQYSHSSNNLQFHFVAVDINNNDDIEYACKLEGTDNNYWVLYGEGRTAIYSNLKPGTYTFKVRARHVGDNKWAMLETPFTFVISPPWWQTWWFRLLMSACVLTVIILLVRVYFSRKLQKQKTILERKQAVERERTRIATDMHDDFGATLSRIKFLSEKLKLLNHETVLKPDLEKISAFSDEMADKMGEIIWALNEKNDTAGDLFSYCRSYASEYLGGTHRLGIEVRDLNESLVIPGEVRRNIFLCFKEVLNNIQKHAKASEVKILFEYNTNREGIVVIIHDNGTGIDFDTIRPYANGISNIYKRMLNAGGTAEISNDKGAKIILYIPLPV